MEGNERELIEQLSTSHPDVKVLWDEHVIFEKQLHKLEKKSFLTPDEEVQVKQLKKQKLDGKTKLIELLNQYGKK